MTPQEALAQAIPNDANLAYWEDRLYHSPEDRIDLAVAILAALPEGWHLSRWKRVEGEFNESYAAGMEHGAQQERERLRAKAQKHHDAQHHGPAVYSTAETWNKCSVPSCREATMLLAEPLR